jgi:hypothetical protein
MAIAKVNAVSVPVSDQNAAKTFCVEPRARPAYEPEHPLRAARAARRSARPLRRSLRRCARSL